jgi:hypothetical protein
VQIQNEEVAILYTFDEINVRSVPFHEEKIAILLSGLYIVILFGVPFYAK